MRKCSGCHADDRPQLDAAAECSCKVESLDPVAHGPDCRAVVHKVMFYPVRMAPHELTHDAAGVPGLPSHHAAAGWKLWQNGGRCYRVKFLCRDCIGKQEDAAQFKRDYQRACKSARGQDDTTYAQMLARQSMI